MKNKIYIFILVQLLFGFIIKGQTIYPYLQSATPTSIYVTWKTSSNTQSLIQYGLSPTNLNLSANGTNQIWTDNGYSNNYYYHSVQLTGLSANTKYYYKVITGGQTSTVC